MELCDLWTSADLLTGICGALWSFHEVSSCGLVWASSELGPGSKWVNALLSLCLSFVNHTCSFWCSHRPSRLRGGKTNLRLPRPQVCFCLSVCFAWVKGSLGHKAFSGKTRKIPGKPGWIGHPTKPPVLEEYQCHFLLQVGDSVGATFEKINPPTGVLFIPECIAGTPVDIARAMDHSSEYKFCESRDFSSVVYQWVSGCSIVIGTESLSINFYGMTEWINVKSYNIPLHKTQIIYDFTTLFLLASNQRRNYFNFFLNEITAFQGSKVES